MSERQAGKKCEQCGMTVGPAGNLALHTEFYCPSRTDDLGRITAERDDARAQLATVEARVERAKAALIKEGVQRVPTNCPCGLCAALAILEGDTE